MPDSPPGSGSFGELLGLRLARENDDGSVEVDVEVAGVHLREGGIAHGGLVMTMLDSAMAASIRRGGQPGEWIASVNISTDFLAAAKAGRLVARGWVDRRGTTLAFARGEVRQFAAGDDAANGGDRLRDAAGTLVARAQGIWAIRAR